LRFSASAPNSLRRDGLQGKLPQATIDH